jgi:hypothetical protein
MQRDSTLLAALARLELCLETPLVPGELEVWTSQLEKATAEVSEQLHAALGKDHPQRLAQISQDDPGLSRCVVQLKEGDHESLRRLNAFQAHLHTLVQKAGDFEPNELPIEDALKRFIAEGLALVIHVRKQEVALDTWMSEALDRDRGVVD